MDEVVEDLFKFLKNRYQNNLESVKGGEFVFDYVYLLYYICHKINSNCVRSYIDYHERIKNKKAIINQIKEKCNKHFKYVVTVVLNYEEIGKNSEKTLIIKP